MATISRLAVLTGFHKTEKNFLTYKHSDIKSEWIIYEGMLDYFHGENFLLKHSIFKKYYSILCSIFNDEQKEIINLLYLYINRDKSPFKVFQLKSTDELNDRCTKMIMGKSGLFLMELIFDKQRESEIFGVGSLRERDIWIQRFNSAIKKSDIRPLIRSISDSPRIPSVNTYGGETKSLDIKLNYEPFGTNSLPSDLYVHPIPIRHDSIVEENNETECQFSWNNIFYDNQNNDCANILHQNGQQGVFLVRPKVQQRSSNDHEFTLCALYKDDIQKYAVHQTSNGEYQLIYRKNEPNFIDIPHLCHYYTIKPLNTLKDTKTEQFYLTIPYNFDNIYE